MFVLYESSNVAQGPKIKSIILLLHYIFFLFFLFFFLYTDTFLATISTMIDFFLKIFIYIFFPPTFPCGSSIIPLAL